VPDSPQTEKRIGESVSKPSRSRAATRQAEHRRRQRNGKVVLSVEVDEHPLAEALIRSGRLSAGETQSRNLLSRSVADVLSEWAERWL
jgi:hypothetical protein